MADGDARNRSHVVGRRGFLKLSGSAVCALGLGAVVAAGGTLLTPEAAYATVEGDQTPLTDEEIEAAIQSGEIMTEFPNGPVATYALTDYAVKTIAGASRYETNKAQVLSAFSGCSWAIVASGVGYADSICAAGLAGALECPIILTEADKLSQTAIDCIKSIGASNILLLGSTDVASQQVEDSLRSLVGGTVERLWGADRYATQMAVYEYGVSHQLWSGDLAVVSNATGFADALAISPISYKYKAPVFYVDGTNRLPSAQEAAVRACGKKRFLITGDEKVMSPSVESLLKSLGGSVKRLAGANRYKTSLAIAQYAVSDLGMSWNGAAITSGSAPYDALGGGPVQGKENSVIVLMEEDDYHNAPFVPFPSKPASMKFFGDKAIYSSAYKTRFALQAGYRLTDIEGLRVYVDAGHGGSDPGASGSGYKEYQLTAELAQKVGNYLQSNYGISAYVNTKGNDYKLRHPEAKAMDCSVFVSIHFNASGGSGTESYVHSANSAAGSRALQHSTHTRLVSALGLRNRGELDEWFAVVSGPLPSVLLEICFIDNSNDMRTYQGKKEAVAQAIAQGIAEA
ncbi:cell wall-binding repeat-containing protein [Olsenella sp. An188]|uniref:cell wall-binding repeat-containing protein n=1 Tax=Olsenella sp. An188 TaxID=1965579 RepID=UPI000B366115|nr:cell wall-binding repeat-containing protein [Olsenella sp. An188]OUP39652.1 hypothetical protein B5F23_01310 [Olsenella sp. An188]